MEAGQRALPP